MHPRSPEDLWSGLLFTVVGAGFAIGAVNYSFGQSARPGPGYFPFGLGVLLALLGLGILLKAFVGARDEDDGRNELPIAWRPLLIVVSSIVLFGLALPLLGMAFALPILMIVISLAGDQFHWRDVLLNCLILTVGSWAVFIKGLQLTIPLWPSFMH